MFLLRGSWFWRGIVAHAPRRSPPPLGVEPLEDRLAPTAGLFFSFLLNVAGRTGDHPLSTAGSHLPLAASKWDSIRSDARRGDGANHPFLTALAMRADGLSPDNGLVRSIPSTPIVDPPSPVVSLRAGFVSMSLMPAPVKPASPPMNLSLSASAVASQGALVYVPKRLPSGEALGFPAFNPMTRKPAGKDRPLNFALSPFTPSGLDIVPVPVPRGLEEKLADLFGDPPSVPPDGSTAGALSAGDDRDYAAIRDAVRQLLQESGPFAPMGPQQAEDRLPLSAAEGNAPNAATDAIFSAGTPLDPTPDEDAEGPAAPSATRAVLALLAAGVSFAGQQTGQRETHPRQRR